MFYAKTKNRACSFRFFSITIPLLSLFIALVIYYIHVIHFVFDSVNVIIFSSLIKSQFYTFTLTDLPKQPKFPFSFLEWIETIPHIKNQC